MTLPASEETVPATDEQIERWWVWISHYCRTEEAFPCTVDEWKSLVARIRASEPVWQDIATAPRDGTRILLFLEPTKIVMPFHWTNGQWMGDDFPLNIARPTYWRSVPAPPTSLEGVR